VYREGSKPAEMGKASIFQLNDSKGSLCGLAIAEALAKMKSRNTTHKSNGTLVMAYKGRVYTTCLDDSCKEVLGKRWFIISQKHPEGETEARCKPSVNKKFVSHCPRRLEAEGEMTLCSP